MNLFVTSQFFSIYVKGSQKNRLLTEGLYIHVWIQRGNQGSGPFPQPLPDILAAKNVWCL